MVFEPQNECVLKLNNGRARVLKWPDPDFSPMISILGDEICPLFFLPKSMLQKHSTPIEYIGMRDEIIIQLILDKHPLSRPLILLMPSLLLFWTVHLEGYYT
ncbi:hypothetical protein MAR_038360 [Mya arenaria]|uniref:Uncharacterized protein n=1 Tax=Mya arenaria TaxID=6604 RepID=A0ABY7FV19_MYAAR|nr:hypothetical protein MAR_038360 [Mya arenaria]